MSNNIEIGQVYIGKNSEVVTVVGVERMLGHGRLKSFGPGQVDFRILRDPSNMWDLKETWTYVPFFLNYFKLTEVGEAIYGS